MMMDLIVKIMAKLLSVLALATKQIKQGRLSKYTLTYNFPRLNVPQRNSRKSYWGRAR